ncbi:acetyltransferase [Beduini massiliensis]|uniref:acetyltransferase n=1 Tax=Beduini massiliensis TaxID=1585974 RepID=UPI00059AB0E6|nr:acetyltransferase [Beduini massiliensis]
MNELIVIGAGGHGKVVADIAYNNGYTNISFLDDYKKEINGYKVIGKIKDIENFDSKGYDFIIAIGNNAVREKIQNQLKDKGCNLVTLIHESAFVSKYTEVGKGTVIMPNSVINAGSKIGEGCIINTGCTIDHDCTIQNYVHISPGAHVAGTVEIGKRTWVGIGSSIINNIKICEDCIFGAGSVVIKDIFNSGTYVGMPVRKI